MIKKISKKSQRKAKLIHLDIQQYQNLVKIRDEIIKKNGYTTISQLIRDSIQLLIDNYREEITQNYMPWKPEKRNPK